MNNSKESGAALAEMAIILPLALFLCFAGATVSYHVRTKVHAASIAGTANQVLYRDCRYEHPLVRGDCMDNLKAQIELTNQVTGFETRVIFSYYEDPTYMTSDGPFSTPALFHRTLSPVTLGGQAEASQVDVVPSRPELWTHFTLGGTVWVTEVFVRNPISFFGYGGNVYEVAIG